MKNALFIGYGFRDYILSRTLASELGSNFKFKLLYRVNLVMSLKGLCNYKNLVDDCIGNFPGVFYKLSRYDRILLAGYLHYLVDSIRSADVVILQGKDRLFEFTAHHIAKTCGKKILFFESAHPGFVYLSEIGVSGEAKLVSSISANDQGWLRDEKLRLFEYVRMFAFQFLTFHHLSEFSFIRNFVNKRKGNFKRTEVVTSVFNSIIFLGQVTDDINHKKFGVSSDNIIRHIERLSNGRKLFYKHHPRERNNQVYSDLKSAFIDMIDFEGNLHDLVNRNNIIVTVNSTAALELISNFPKEEIYVLGLSFFEFLIDGKRQIQVERLEGRSFIKSGYRSGKNFVSFNFLKTLRYVLQ